jgi:hypothetical protein
MIDLPYDVPSDNMFKPIVTVWTNRIEAAEKARASWKEVVDEIVMFYGKSAAAMFNPTYQKKFWPGKVQPRFRISINLAYEWVRVMLPELMWEVPHRTVKPKRMIEIPEGLLDEQTAQMVTMEQQFMRARAELAGTLQEAWLNYTSREMPGNGLAGHSSLSVLDMLLKGRGVKCIRPYTFPGSKRLITGCFREPPEKILLDPDAKCMDEIRWLAIVHTEPHWEVERRFKLPENSLAKKASLESSWSNSESNAYYVPATHHIEGKSNDMVVWYEIYSKCGVGTRRTELYEPVKVHLEETVGDFAYLAICPAIPFPLNAPLQKVIRDKATSEEVRKMFEWPIPSFYKDDRWPVEFLDMYPNIDEKDEAATWPIPPLAPALGEIKVLNYIVPFLVNRTWMSSRDFWAIAGPYAESLRKEVEKAEDQAFLNIPAVVDDISKVLTIMQQPEGRRDMWELIGLVESMFRKRTGMVLSSYGMNEDGTQNRSAEETVAKHRAANSTPEFMQNKVVGWESRCAAAEAAVARRVIRSESVQGLLGPTLARLWDQMVASDDSDEIAAQLDYQIEAASIRRPNLARDIADFQQVMQYWLPIDMQYAGQTGDYTPINATKKRWGKLHDVEMDEMMIPDNSQGEEAMQQQQQEQQAQMQQQQMQMEQQRMQLEMTKLQADAEAKQMDAAGKQLDLQGKQMDLQSKQMDVETEMLKSQLELQGEQAKLAIQQTEGEMTLAQKTAELQFERAKAQQDLEMSSGKSLMDILMGREKLEQQRVGAEIKNAAAIGAAKIKQQAAKQATKQKAKPKSKAKK